MDHLPIGEGLQQSLKSPSAPIRRDAIATLVHIYTTSGSSDAQMQTLLDSFAHYDSDDRVREIAGTALGWNPRLIEAIAVLFNASPVPQRLEAVVALRYFLTEGKEVEVLLAHEWLARLAHHDEDEQVREAANQALPKPQQRPSTRFAEPEPGRVRPESGPTAEPTYRRKSWIPWLAGLFSVGLAFGVAAFVLLDRNHLLQPNGSPVRGCGQPIKMISVGGGSVYFQQPGGSSLTTRRMLSLDGRSSGVIDRPGIAYSYDLAPDETHIVESRYENVHPNFFIYTWTTSEFAQWNERMLIDGQFPSWSPDMKQIAFFKVYGVNRSSLYVMEADGSNVRLLKNVGDVNSPASWSPDASRLLVSTSEIGATAHNLVIVRLDDASETPLLSNGLTAEYPAWSHDGKSIAYVSHDIYTINTDGSNRHNLTDGKFQYITNVGWSPDSKNIAFLANEAPGRQAIYLMDSDGQGLHELSSTCNN